MGYYIQTPNQRNKAEQLRDLHGGEIVQTISLDYHKIPEGKALIVVVDNGPFEAAGFCCNESEFECFTNPDDFRPKKFVYLDRALAEELSGYNR
jgi:hypothetical protein